MRLLHTKSLQFEDFFDVNIPKYAILSHRWDAKEIPFQDFQDSEDKSGVGFAKIRNFCSLVENEGFEWVWIDTCCIDKRSSAELSGAINSMYRWYANAEKCYAYLSDVLLANGDLELSRARFRESVWFTRGWTLQELLAPRTVIFLDSRWEFIGTKADLLEDISAVTGIKVRHLDDPKCASVATKMSWASKRKTSRIEDVAYCLMGIFDINMPLLYGEGRKAFLRLELEIIKNSDDESIFAWNSPEKIGGLLATWPSSFADSGDDYEFSTLSNSRLPCSMTNKGLEYHIPRSAKRTTSTLFEEVVVVLGCWVGGLTHARCIILRTSGGYKWYRADCDKLHLSEAMDDRDNKDTEVIYVQQPGLQYRTDEW